MFISANPRYVPNNFNTFVPIQRVESLHQRLVEMTNNNVNAWSVFKPVASSTDSWDHSDDFNRDENFQSNVLYGGGYPQDTSAPQCQSKTVSYTAVNYGQPQNRLSNSSRVYQEPASSVNSYEILSPMLASNCHQWSSVQGRGNFAEFLKGQNGSTEFKYQSANESDPVSITSYSFLNPTPSSYTEDTLTTVDSFNMDKTSPSTAYSCYSPTNTSIDPQALISLGMRSQNNPGKSPWWSEIQHSSSDGYQDCFDVPLMHDELSKCQHEQEQFYPWNIESSSWDSQPAASTTISPKALTLNISSTPVSSLGSSQGAMFSLSASRASSRVRDDTGYYSGPKPLVVEQPMPVRRHRQALPNSSLTCRKTVPVLPSNNSPPSKNSKKRPLQTRIGVQPRTKPSSNNSNANSSFSSFVHKPEVAPLNSSAPKRIEPKPTTTVTHQPWSTSSQSISHYRDAKDDFLVRSKLAGMSYKDIRRQGKFTEAESTLRGRFRTLTKQKAARVRKPEWNDNDIRLLKKAVRKLAHGFDTTTCRIPWKQVAEYIANNGGSYHFGNATCHKRWDDLQRRLGL